MSKEGVRVIQGIDTKVVTPRATDYMRENNANLKNAEFAQTMRAKLEKDRKANEAKSVVHVKKGEHSAVNPDGRNAQPQPGEPGKKKPKITKQTKAAPGDSTQISGNEAVGYEKNGSLDIEV